MSYDDTHVTTEHLRVNSPNGELIDSLNSLTDRGPTWSDPDRAGPSAWSPPVPFSPPNARSATNRSQADGEHMNPELSSIQAENVTHYVNLFSTQMAKTWWLAIDISQKSLQTLNCGSISTSQIYCIQNWRSLNLRLVITAFFQHDGDFSSSSLLLKYNNK